MRVRTMWRGAWVAALCVAVACSSSGGDGGSAAGQTGGSTGGGVNPPPDGGANTNGNGNANDNGNGNINANSNGGSTTLKPPFTKDHWTFYGQDQGLSATIFDVTADEGGNVYVAGGDALYAKPHGAQAFQRFDATTSGLTQNCYVVANPDDHTQLDGRIHPNPPGPAVMCPVISVGGGAPGVAMIGFQGVGTDGDNDADWAQDSGGADLVAFDGTAVSRTRHVFIASPPHQICVMPDASGTLREGFADSCDNPPDPFFWQVGRRKLRQVFRIAVNHQKGSPMYGDTWMGGTHATLAVYLNNASQRGWVDKTAGWGPVWADAKDVWEHDHPGIIGSQGQFLTGYSYAVAIDPRNGTPWGSNGFRTASMVGYGGWVQNKVWWLQTPWLDVWPDGTGVPEQLPASDNVQALAFCDDGTLWMGSDGHGLARRFPDGTVQTIGLPDPGTHGDSVTALACDPSDHSLWIGLGWGGVMRLSPAGAFTLLDTSGLPAVAGAPVRSIQIDRWSSPRVVYFAFLPLHDASGALRQPGGVAAYDGP